MESLVYAAGVAMPLYIRDDDVRALATELARKQHCTLTDAVRSALKDALARIETERAEKLRRTEEILAEFDAAPRLRPGFTDRDLYDENGLPIL